ncbi:protein kinase domain-containing protein [Enhygromyxa salina]|uniref:histidine kinase n=1 Tax=Enhygromyxa salina TaxID=215803 RepID=A0A2S9XCI4_9BACT|nr:AAA family ATPase [Enhygromyxa salina]PRP90391.1 Blue-light-activated protein [Enhygromyxa salina]
MSFPGFEPGPLIHAGSRSQILRARRQHDGVSVVLKTVASGRPGSQAIARLRREWEIGQMVVHANVVRYLSFEVAGPAAAIVMEDFEGVSLAERIPAHGFSIDRLLEIAVQLARGLSAIHARGVIHKDVKPHNILIDADGEHLKFIDFGVSARLDDGEQLTISPSRLEGTLAYISPEQTGRMNRALDHRADLYSLGVTLYELLCGQVPFAAADALELVHCHLAKLPDPPTDLRPETPEQLSRIILKLLAKAPEDRYQTSRGLHHDLLRVRDLLRLHANDRVREPTSLGLSVPPFELGAHDRGPELRVSTKLFGRDLELETLERAWAQTQRGDATIVLISGSSGVGKSALVSELETRLRARPGTFISGKFSQLGGGAAYEAFATAFRTLAGRILGAGMDEFSSWRARLSDALAINGRILLDVVPEMEPIVGPLPAVAPLGPEESQQRFNQVLRRFVRACATRDHPLTLFLDDLQWADPGSLALLELLASDDEQRHLLLVTSVRDDELGPTHPTGRSLANLRRQHPSAIELSLRALGVAEVETLISVTLGGAPPRPRALAELVVERTAGNPLFVRTFLQMAWEEQLLTADAPLELRDDLDAKPSVSWTWDEVGLRQMQASESVGELLARRLLQLPASTREALRTAACLSGSFTPETVAAINDAPTSATVHDLRTAARAGMILLRDDERWDFVHNRVREAAYGLLPPHERAAAHLRIGEMLLANTPADRLAERVFNIVDHLDIGRALITDARALARLGELARLAGERAHKATAYETAVRYLRTGIACLDLIDLVDARDPMDESASVPRSWREHYELALGLHRELAIAEYLSDELDSSRARIATALEYVHDPVDRVELFDLLVSQQTMAAHYAEAIETGARGLALLGIELPVGDDAIDQALTAALAEYRERLLERLGGRPLATLIELPDMQRRDTRGAARLLATMMSAAYSDDSRLFPLVTLQLVNLTLAHGSLPESAFGYANHGTFVGAVLGDHEAAYEWGKLALALARKHNDLAQEARACYIVAGFLLPWCAAIDECEALNDRGEQAARDAGQLQFVGYIHYQRQLLHLFAGTPLSRLEGELARALPRLIDINHVYAANVVRGVQLIVAALLGDLPAGEVRGLAELEREFLADCRQRHSHIAICVYQIYSAQLSYLHGDPAAALACIAASKESLPYAVGHVALADRNFYHSLALAASLPDLPEDRRRLALTTIEHNQDQLAQWAKSAPQNFEHKHLLVAAELARLDGELLAALDLYERAIASALTHRFTHVHALASELAARMWLARGSHRLARPFMAAALAGYRSWGARKKLRLLEAEHPQLVHELALDTHTSKFSRTSEHWPGSASSQALDLATVTRASQAISSEIDLDRLLARMMRIILLNAGANRGFLILESEDDFRIEAAASSEIDAVELHDKRPLADADLAVGIVRHVLRSGDNVVLEDAHRRGPFTDEPHVVRRRLKSVLCTPIRHKDGLVGVLYLENELTAGAFTNSRTEVLQILLSQAAISLENARYYNELETLNAELRRRADELAASKTQLEVEISERERGQAKRVALEDQLRQSQKMEAIGQLAGGVAHDFNNLLTTIIGSTDVLSARMRVDPQGPGSDTGAAEVRVIREAAERGASLTRQLLAFSRRQVLQPEVVDLNALVERGGAILERLLGAEYELHVRLGEQLGRVRVDPGQLEQVILNLVINARDASDPGGKVWLATRAERLTQLRPGQPHDVRPGDWVVLEVSDTGMGMKPESIAHIFEPFYTTKGVGKGTGLGLSTVLGIVQQSDGALTVTTKLGVGTTFEIWLPCVEAPADQERRDPEREEPELDSTQRHETVLVVEDEAPVRRTVEQILALSGYAVHTAEDGEASLELFHAHAGTIDLVLTDFVMPRLGGLDLATKLRALQPDIKILFMSGFTAGQLAQDKIEALGGIELIEKPFRAAALLERVRKMLDR